MRALVEDMTSDHPARAAVVVSNNAGAGGIAWARAQGIATEVIDHRPYGPDRAAFEAHMQTVHFAKVDQETADMVAEKIVHTGLLV